MVRRNYENRREQVLDGALAVFADRGYEGASLREIAEAAGLEKGHVSYYFSAKEDLLFEIIDATHGSFIALISTAHADAPPTECLRDLARRHVLLVCENLAAARVLYEDFRFLSPDKRRRVVVKRDAYERHVRGLVARCCSRPIEDPAVALATRGVLGIVNWPYQWFQPDGSISAVAVADAAATMALGAVHAMADSASDDPGHSGGASG